MSWYEQTFAGCDSVDCTNRFCRRLKLLFIVDGSEYVCRIDCSASRTSMAMATAVDRATRRDELFRFAGRAPLFRASELGPCPSRKFCGEARASTR